MRVVEPSFQIASPVDGEAILLRIEAAGRTCYRSEGKIAPGSAVTFVRKIIASGHHSVLEHESVSVRIVCDRGVSHEIVRHRLASYSQESTRYCNYAGEKFGGELQFIKPPDMHDFSMAVWYALCSLAEQAYLDMLSLGESPQIARSVLPNSLKTELMMTCNLREWRHFFSLRTAEAAHSQMRQIARPLLAEFRRLIPVVFDDVGVLSC